ncbi:hypothetical protein BDV36DRAFT_34776 [Aspergillus pseudocaelatus]|uniref:Secreted protein n=1 Tax=Aspergillus pseudocaelatus TaxID=1825620 RepID=A0ABQ6W8M7_9EURO|nr:hypothetical protein BDV36DRAFT_34776 [Aspergillus pseudocaelatus]
MLSRHMAPSCLRLSWVFGTCATIQPLKLRCNCCLGGESLGIAKTSRDLAALYNTRSCREMPCLHFKENMLKKEPEQKRRRGGEGKKKSMKKHNHNRAADRQ